MINSWSISVLIRAAAACSRCSGCPGGIPALNGRSSCNPVDSSVSEGAWTSSPPNGLPVSFSISTDGVKREDTTLEGVSGARTLSALISASKRALHAGVCLPATFSHLVQEGEGPHLISLSSVYLV